MSARRARQVWWIVMCVLIAGAVTGCGAAAPDASKARSRSVIQSGGIVPAEELRVAEYLNYYQQDFPEPAGTALGLDLRLGNPQIPASGGEVWLQIGLQARRAENDAVAPLNLALVIDRSGSMDTPEKMPYLKQALRVFLESLAPEDVIAIVAYSTEAEVVLPAQQAGDRRWIQSTIDRLYPKGNTNLYAGLMLGFQEVERHFDIRRNNRVILLTDGLANRGETDADVIARDALAYNDRGIYLSTIGLGRDFSDALLSRLANQGHGGYHFIDSAEEMDKVFREEVAGLLQKVAGDVSVIVQPGDGVQVLGITGYNGQPPAGPVEIRLRDMGTGDSQVVLAQLHVEPGGRGERRLAEVELKYTDLFAQRAGSARLPVLAAVGTTAGADPLIDVEVLRNVTVQRTAEGLREIDRLYKEARYQEAWELAYRLEGKLREVARLTGEEQMVKDAELMRQYQGTLAQWVRNQTGHEPEAPEEPGVPRLRRGTVEPGVPVIEVE